MPKPDRAPSLNPAETKVLAFLSTGSVDFGFYCFAPIIRYTRLKRPEVRRACRSLARKGLAQYGRGLWTDSGEPRGSGYGVTAAGRLRADLKLTETYARRKWR